MTNQFHFGWVMWLVAASSSAVLAETVIPVYEDSHFTATAQFNACTSACTKTMAVTAVHQFVFDGDYNHLYNELATVGIKVTVYDDDWLDSDSGELYFKLVSARARLQFWRNRNRHRKVDNLTEAASAIYAIAIPGQVVSLEFLQQPVVSASGDFTVNVRRYRDEVLIGSGSRAVRSTETGGNTYEP